MNLAAEINQATAGISVGWIITSILAGLGTLFFYLAKTAVDRYFKTLDQQKADDKEKAKDIKAWQKNVLENLSNMNKGLNEVNTKHIYMLEKINRTEHVLEETVKDVGKLKLEVGILSKMK